MLNFIDLSTNECDDIYLSGDDISVENDQYVNVFKNAERRLSSRETDFLVTSELSAGLERLLQSKVNSYLLSDIESDIRSSLNQSDLLTRNDFQVLFDVNEDKVGILLKLNIPDSSYSLLNIFVDRLNQRAYR